VPLEPRAWRKIHPQDLWITLWASFGVGAQVAYRKGFFLLCLKFERFGFSLRFKHLLILSPVEPRARRMHPATPLSSPKRWIDIALYAPGNVSTYGIPTRGFPLSYAANSASPTRPYHPFLNGRMRSRGPG
jgi:hypothetical protein